ncbi:MAG: DUF4114 domain-containing protein [Parvularcula sp.]|nr:DUF4114 domain-containing protein [Parvularcula sp.]
MNDLSIEYHDVIENSGDYVWYEQKKNAFHRYGDEHEANFKVVTENKLEEYIFRHTDGGFELVTDPRNAGSYNFAAGFFGHTELDVAPWALFGNHPDDPSRFDERPQSGVQVLTRGVFDDDDNVAKENRVPDRIFERTPFTDFFGADFREINENERVIFRGFSGDDIVISGPQNDEIFGGKDNDTVSYVNSKNSGVAVNLQLGFGHNGYASWDNLHETIEDVENLIGSDLADILIGSQAGNVIAGGGGNDYADGAGGDDFFVVSGALAEYGFASSPDGGVLLTKGSETDTLHNFEFISFSDVLTTIDGTPFDGPVLAKTTKLTDDQGVEIGSVTLEAPTFTGDGDAEYTLTLGGLSGVQFNIAYIIDVSGSMSGSKIAEARNAYVELTNRLKTEGIAEAASFAVIPFNSSSTLQAPLDADGAIAAVQGLGAGGGTSFGPALTRASEFFANTKDTQTNVAYFLSDGQGSGASASLTSVANVQAFGIGSGADLSALSIIDSDTAVALSDASQLLDALAGSSVDPTDLDRIELSLNGTLIETIFPDQLQSGSLGLTYTGQITGLDTSSTGGNAVIATIFRADGTEIGSAATQIAPVTRTARETTENGVTEIVFGALTSGYEALAGQTINLTANDLDNDIVVEDAEGSISAMGGADTIRLGAFARTTVDRIVDGGDGFDRVIYKGNYEASAIARVGALLQVGSNTDFLSNVEEVVFDDAVLDVGTMTVSLREIYEGTNDPETILANAADNLIDARAGDDEVRPGEGVDRITTGFGADSVIGTMTELDGDTVVDLRSEDEIVFEGIELDRSSMSFSAASGLLSFDMGDDGSVDGTVTLEGSFIDGDFMAVAFEGETTVTFETYLPFLASRQAVDPDLVNGILNQNFLRGDGSTDFKVTLRDLGFAGYDNVLGVYEITSTGEIVDTRLLIENANADKSAEVTITDVEAGNTLGFFIVQNAADWAASLSDSDTFEFVNSSGAVASVGDGDVVRLAINGVVSDETVFHSYVETLNVDGLQYALSGVDFGGEGIVVGFEDLTGGGDRDYEDVAFQVLRVDADTSLIA